MIEYSWRPTTRSVVAEPEPQETISLSFTKQQRPESTVFPLSLLYSSTWSKYYRTFVALESYQYIQLKNTRAQEKKKNVLELSLTYVISERYTFEFKSKIENM